MPDTTDDIAEGISFQAFEDDCRLLGSLLHDVLLRELGPRFIHILERNRILAQVYIYNHLTIVALSSYLDIA
jgi:phosphoenolpyruvate carboxylase